MKAAVIRAPREVGVAEVPVPEPGPREVLVRIDGSGICGSEIPAYEGRDWFDYPLDAGRPGHEGWGTIEACGSETTGIEPGTRVTLLSERAHAEFDVAPVDSLVPVPAALGEGPFPGEPLGCVMNIFDRSDIAADQTVAVVGIGFLGALLTQLAAAAGARVIALSRRASSLEVAEQMGAAELVSVEADAVGAVEKATDRHLCDRVIECTGKQRPLDIAGAITRTRGRLVIAGYHQDGRRSVDMQMWNWRGLDVVNAHERDPQVYISGIKRAAEAIDAGRLDPAPLYTHSFPLAQAGAAFEAAADRPDGFMKALVLA